MTPPDVHVHRYSNGLELVLAPSRAAPVVALELWVRVGSADEEPRHAGICHLTEHMLFKGTRRRGAGVMAREIEAVGGDINAYTTPDHTVYSAVVASRYVGLALELLADAVLESVFDPAELGREQAVVLDEIQRGEDLPQQVLTEHLFAAAYARHPYARPVVGRQESVASLDRETCVDFFRGWYRPCHMTLVAAGDFDREEVVAEVGRALGSAHSGNRRPKRLRPREPLPRGFRSVLQAREVNEVYLELALPGPPANHPDSAAVDLLVAVLGHGEASRLQRSLKLRRNLVCGVGAARFAPLDTGLIQFSAVVEGDKFETAYPVLCREVFRLCHEPVGADELARCRTNLEADLIYEQETVEGQAQQVGHFHQLCGGLPARPAYLKALRSVDPVGLVTVARRYLRWKLAVLAGLHPQDRTPPWTPESVAELTRTAARAPGRPRQGRRRADPVTCRRLANGVRVVVKENRHAPLVAVRAAVRGGLYQEPARQAGAFHLMTMGLLSGTQRHDAVDIAHRADDLCGQFDGFSGRSSWGLRGEFLSRYLAEGLDFFAELLTRPVFPEEEVEKAREDTLSGLRLRRDDAAELALRRFERLLYGRHPYGRDLLGTERSVAGLDARALRRLHARALRPDTTVVAVVGDVETEPVLERLTAALQHIAPVGTPLALPLPPLWPARPRHVRETVSVGQAHLVLGFLGCRVSDPERNALRVTGAILSGQGGRMFRQLREVDGLGYAVDVIGAEGMDAGYLAAQVTTAPDRQEDARCALLDQFGSLARGEFAEDEVAEARRKLVGGFELALQENASQAAQLALDELYGMGCRAFRRYPEDIFAVSREQVAAVAARYLEARRHVAVLLSPTVDG